MLIESADSHSLEREQVAAEMVSHPGLAPYFTCSFLTRLHLTMRGPQRFNLLLRPSYALRPPARQMRCARALSADNGSAGWPGSSQRRPSPTHPPNASPRSSAMRP